jgi:hypothetical protein
MSADIGLDAVFTAVEALLSTGKSVFEKAQFSTENKSLVREFNTLWKRKSWLEEALFAYNRMEERIWVPSVNALAQKSLTAGTVMRRARKQLEAEGTKGPFNTGIPSSRFKPEAVKKSLIFLFSSDAKNKKDREKLEELRKHNLTLAASIVAWGQLEMLYCRNIVSADPARKKATAIAVKMRMRKIARDATSGRILEGRLLTGKRAMSLASAPTRIIE